MASPRKQSGQAATKEISTRKNFDKRTIRKMYSAPFESAINRESGRRSEGGEAVLQYSAQDVQVLALTRWIVTHPIMQSKKTGNGVCSI